MKKFHIGQLVRITEKSRFYGKCGHIFQLTSRTCLIETDKKYVCLLSLRQIRSVSINDLLGLLE